MGVNWLASKIPRQQPRDFREGVATGGGLVGGVKAESSGNIYFPYQFLHGESSNARTHTTSSGRRPNLKPVLRGSARYFIGRDQRTPSSRRSYVRMCSSRRDKGRQKTKRLNRIQRLYCILLLFLDIEVLFINFTLSL